MRTYDDLRKALPTNLPFAMREAIIGNVVVGNFSANDAVIIGFAISQKIRAAQPPPAAFINPW